MTHDMDSHGVEPSTSHDPLPTTSDRPAGGDGGWTWPAVVLTCVLVLAALAFIGFLVLIGTDPYIACPLAVGVVVAVIVAVVPDRFRRSTLQRIGAVLIALGGGDGR